MEVRAHNVISIFHQSLAVRALVVRAESLTAQIVCAYELRAHDIVRLIQGRGELGALVVGAFGFAAVRLPAHTAAIGGAIHGRGGAVGALDVAAVNPVPMVVLLLGTRNSNPGRQGNQYSCGEVST